MKKHQQRENSAMDESLSIACLKISFVFWYYTQTWVYSNMVMGIQPSNCELLAFRWDMPCSSKGLNISPQRLKWRRDLPWQKLTFRELREYPTLYPHWDSLGSVNYWRQVFQASPTMKPEQVLPIKGYQNMIHLEKNQIQNCPNPAGF